MSSLLDQSALTDLADRLVAAARRAGADAADALAVRSVSLAVEVREGAVEESERSEGDDVGLRVFLGSRQAVVSTNDIKTDVAAARRAGGRHGAGRRPKTRSRALRIRRCLRTTFPTSICSIPIFRPSRSWRSAPNARRAPALRSKA